MTCRIRFKSSHQYRAYAELGGTSSSFDGAEHNTSDNNTLYLQAWIAF
jgi:hypothetical protein